MTDVSKLSVYAVMSPKQPVVAKPSDHVAVSKMTAYAVMVAPPLSTNKSAP